jgi:hypothetical protein
MPRAAADHQPITGALDGVHTSGILGPSRSAGSPWARRTSPRWDRGSEGWPIPYEDSRGCLRTLSLVAGNLTPNVTPTASNDHRQPRLPSIGRIGVADVHRWAPILLVSRLSLALIKRDCERPAHALPPPMARQVLGADRSPNDAIRVLIRVNIREPSTNRAVIDTRLRNRWLGVLFPASSLA